jgi:hypothetical protein
LYIEALRLAPVPGGADIVTACSGHNRTIRNIVLIRAGGMQKQKKGKSQSVKRTPRLKFKSSGTRIHLRIGGFAHVTAEQVTTCFTKFDHVKIAVEST